MVFEKRNTHIFDRFCPQGPQGFPIHRVQQHAIVCLSRQRSTHGGNFWLLETSVSDLQASEACHLPVRLYRFASTAKAIDMNACCKLNCAIDLLSRPMQSNHRCCDRHAVPRRISQATVESLPSRCVASCQFMGEFWNPFYELEFLEPPFFLGVNSQGSMDFDPKASTTTVSSKVEVNRPPPSSQSRQDGKGDSFTLPLDVPWAPGQIAVTRAQDARNDMVFRAICRHHPHARTSRNGPRR